MRFCTRYHTCGLSHVFLASTNYGRAHCNKNYDISREEVQFL